MCTISIENYNCIPKPNQICPPSVTVRRAGNLVQSISQLRHYFFEISGSGEMEDRKILEPFLKALQPIDPFLNCKKLKGITFGKFGIRLGDYRMRYDVEKKVIWMHSVKHRKDIYKR